LKRQKKNFGKKAATARRVFCEIQKSFMIKQRWFLSGENGFVPEKEISIILPAYNEAFRVEKCIQEVERAVRAFSGSYEIIVAEDGSTDGTEKVMAKLAQNNSRLVFLHSQVRLGKGKAIKRAVHSAKGIVVVFMDVDLATSLDYLPKIVKSAQVHRGMTIGSRHVKGAKVQRRVSRTLFSLTYNLFVRLLFMDGVRDHQCGFKAISREVAEVLLAKSKSNGFFFDTEMILWCKKLGFPVIEVGLEWAETKKKDGSAIRIYPDGAMLGLNLLKFRLNINSS
jgi:glycosyltransferase involved in cell wall biosynthesis